ncbi:hypothetical protein [Streptomyces sp. NPDC088762]|uniref:hypothetical protein n=1 Tax=Streptomyces sp. NPDC088762 TaxID=3365891 RepID=UPI00381D4D8F
MKLPVTLHRARLGAEEFQVIRPARPPERAVLVDDGWFLNVHVDREGGRLIAGLWALAASSPRSLVHLPLRRPGGVEAGARTLDLVLLHHSLQFAPARWKGLRARLGAGRPQSLTVSDSYPRMDHAALHHAENRDLFHQHVHAETLFMTGSAKVFRETAGLFREVADEGPGHVHGRFRSAHYCATLRTGTGRGRELHIQYSQGRSAGQDRDEDRPPT